MSPIPLPEFADKLSKLLPELARGTLRRETNELADGHITMPQFLILNNLVKEGEARMTDIARMLGVSTAAATGLVERLVKSAYVQRLFDANDRRIIKIKLSPKGRELVQRICKQKVRSIIEVFGKIPSEDRDTFLKILERVREIVIGEKDPEKS